MILKTKEVLEELFKGIINNFEDVPKAGVRIVDENMLLKFDDKEIGINIEQLLEQVSDMEQSEAINYLADIVKNAYYVASSVDSLANDCLKAEYVLKNVDIRICNREDRKFVSRNRKREMVYKEYLDLCIYFSVDSTDKSMSVPITRKVLDDLGISEEELFAAAMKNLQKKHHAIVNPICDCFNGLNIIDDLRVNQFEKLVDSESLLMVRLSNSMIGNGATAILMDGVLRRLASIFGNDLLLLPSSKDEWVIISAELLRGEEDVCLFSEMVLNINRNEVPCSERLSNNFYLYKKDEDGIVNVTNYDGGVSDSRTDELLSQLK